MGARPAHADFHGAGAAFSVSADDGGIQRAGGGDGGQSGEGNAQNHAFGRRGFAATDRQHQKARLPGNRAVCAKLERQNFQQGYSRGGGNSQGIREVAGDRSIRDGEDLFLRRGDEIVVRRQSIGKIPEGLSRRGGEGPPGGEESAGIGVVAVFNQTGKRGPAGKSERRDVRQLHRLHGDHTVHAGSNG